MSDDLMEFGLWFWVHVLEIREALPGPLFDKVMFLASLRWNLDGGVLP